jgi:hypothetical protein
MNKRKKLLRLLILSGILAVASLSVGMANTENEMLVTVSTIIWTASMLGAGLCVIELA